MKYVLLFYGTREQQQAWEETSRVCTDSFSNRRTAIPPVTGGHKGPYPTPLRSRPYAISLPKRLPKNLSVGRCVVIAA